MGGYAAAPARFFGTHKGHLNNKQAQSPLPRYPHRAEQAGLEGVALFKFDIDPAGRVHNVRIVASVPHPIFGEAAQDVVETWRYEPRRQDGEAIEAKDIVSSFEFRLAN